MSTAHIPDLTEDLSFYRVNGNSAETLHERRIAVIKNRMPDRALTGIELAYYRIRRAQLPRRTVGAALKWLDLEHTAAYRHTSVNDIKVDPSQISAQRHPLWLPVKAALAELGNLNDELFGEDAIAEAYTYNPLNRAMLFAHPGNNKAIPEHQDSQGAYGLAFAPKPKLRSGMSTSLHHINLKVVHRSVIVLEQSEETWWY